MKLWLCVNRNDDKCGLFIHYPIYSRGSWYAGYCNRCVAKVSIDYAKKYYPELTAQRPILVDYPFRKEGLNYDK